MRRTISRRTDPQRRDLSIGLRWIVLLWAVVVAGCAGGSGSSGFGAALQRENAAIDRALGEEDCEEVYGLTICPSGGEATPISSASPTPPIDFASPTPTEPGPQVTATPGRTRTATPGAFRTPTPSPTASPAQPSAPGIDTNVGSRDSIECEQSDAQAPCLFVFMFDPVGVPADATFAVAVRTRDPDGPWLISEAPGHSAAIMVDPADPKYQIAVLVFLEPPGVLPEEVDLLSDSGADFAFVTPALSSEAP